MIPQPEDLQYLLGIHPDQAANVLAAPVQGQDEEAVPAPDEVPPAGFGTAKPRPISTEPITVAPHADVIPKSRPEIGPPAPEEDAAPATTVPGATPGGAPSSLMTTPIRPISAEQQTMQHLQGREATDRAELERLRDTGSGVSQFQKRHRFLGPLVRGLEIAGTALAPGVAEMVPGTEAHHNLLLNRAGNRVEGDIGDQLKHQTISSKEEADRAREEGISVRERTQNEREKQNQVMNELRQQAQDAKEALRSITYDPATKQFMRGDQIYTPKDFQEGAVLETQHGIANGPYTAKWMAESKNRQPVTRVPSAQQQMYDDWRESFHTENGRWPNAKEINDYRRNHGAGTKDYTSLRFNAEKTKEAELDKLEKQHAHDLALTEDKDEKRRLSEALEANKGRVQRAYEAELAQIPTGEQQPPERITQPAAVPSPGAPPAARPKPAAAVVAKPGQDMGVAPPDAHEGRTGKLPDGTKVIVKGGRLVAQ